MRLTYGKKTEGDSANKLADADGTGHGAELKANHLSRSLYLTETTKSEMGWVEDSRQQCKEVRRFFFGDVGVHLHASQSAGGFSSSQ